MLILLASRIFCRRRLFNFLRIIRATIPRAIPSFRPILDKCHLPLPKVLEVARFADCINITVWNEAVRRKYGEFCHRHSNVYFDVRLLQKRPQLTLRIVDTINFKMHGTDQRSIFKRRPRTGIICFFHCRWNVNEVLKPKSIFLGYAKFERMFHRLCAVPEITSISGLVAVSFCISSSNHDFAVKTFIDVSRRRAVTRNMWMNIAYPKTSAVSCLGFTNFI